MFYYFTWKYSGFLPRLIRNYLTDECWIQKCKMECIVIRNISNTNSRCVYDLSNLILGTTENYEINIGTKVSTLYYMNVFSKWEVWHMSPCWFPIFNLAFHWESLLTMPTFGTFWGRVKLGHCVHMDIFQRIWEIGTGLVIYQLIIKALKEFLSTFL